VLVADDSASQRMRLISWLESDPELEVVGWATNGLEAVRLALALKPDVVTMDLRMPVMDGIEATRRIMEECPTPVVMVTVSASRERQQFIAEAFDAGVLAILRKPIPGPNEKETVRELLRTVKSMSQVVVIRRWQGGIKPSFHSSVTSLPSTPMGGKAAAHRLEVVTIGASTGGPQALKEVLSHLPSDFPLPVLVVQHIAQGFTAGLVDWLRLECAVPMRVVVEETPLRAPGVYVALAGQHMVVKGGSLILTDDPPVSGHRPSATLLFQSASRLHGPAVLGVLLTGMGDDGAAGLRDIKRAGGYTIAQDESTSVVFGMPAVAIAMGVVDHVLPLPLIGNMIVELERRSREG